MSQRDHLLLLRFFQDITPCQQRLISPVGANVLGRLSMAGFEVITYGPIWVTAEESAQDDE